MAAEVWGLDPLGAGSSGRTGSRLGLPHTTQSGYLASGLRGGVPPSLVEVGVSCPLAVGSPPWLSLMGSLLTSLSS